MGETCKRGINSSRIAMLQNAYRGTVPRTFTFSPEGKKGVIRETGLPKKRLKAPISKLIPGDAQVHVSKPRSFLQYAGARLQHHLSNFQ
jgi:hypothetical protein